MNPAATTTRGPARRLAALTAFVAGALVLAGCDNNQAKSAAPPQQPPAQVGVVTVKARPVEITTELPGRVSAFLVAEVRPQIGGIIIQRPFQEGAEIKAGDMLYEIDPASYRAAYDSAKAALDKSEANVGSLELKANRYRELAKIKAVSQQDYDDAAASLKVSQADVAAARAALDTARINLAYTRVTAPISGRIGRSSVTQGALVTASQTTALATIQQLDPIKVDVTQSATEIMRLKKALASGVMTAESATAKVRLILDDGTPYDQEGKLEFSDVTVDEGTGSITLRAIFPNPKQELLPGMYVRAVVQQGVNAQALLVPQRGVTRDQRGNPTAWFVGADGKAEMRTLKVARSIGTDWLVAEGVADGDQLIIERLQRLRPGGVVNVASRDGAAVTGDTGAAPAKAN